MRRSLFILALAALLLGVFAVPGAARPGEIQATADAFVIELVDPGESRIDGNVWHVRNYTLLYQAIGDMNPEYGTGFNLSVINWNWNLKNGSSNSWGTFDFTLDDFDGGFSGTFTVNSPPSPDAIPGPDFDPAEPGTWPCGGWTNADSIGRGFGDLQGVQHRTSLDSTNCGGLISYDTTIFFPGG